MDLNAILGSCEDSCGKLCSAKSIKQDGKDISIGTVMYIKY